MVSCLQVTTVFCVLITAVAVIVSFATPNWLEVDTNADLAKLDSIGVCGKGQDCGLWLQCSPSIGVDLENCKWFFADEMLLEKRLPDWYKAVQGLFACAVATSLLALVIGLCALCCYCKSCNPHHAAGAFINLTFLLLAVAVCVFGAKSYLDLDAAVWNKDTENFPLFGWSFWLGCGAAFMSLVSSICYFCLVRQDDYYV